MQKEDKERVVAELTERLRNAETLIVADYRGLTMPQIDALRGQADRERGAVHGRQEHPHPPRGRGRRGGCAAGAARGPVGDRVHRGRRRHGRRRQGAGRLGPRDEGARDPRRRHAGPRDLGADVEELAKLPPLDVLRGQVLGAIIAPLTAIARARERAAAEPLRADRRPDRAAAGAGRHTGRGGTCRRGGRGTSRHRGRDPGACGRHPGTHRRPGGIEMAAVDTVFEQLGTHDRPRAGRAEEQDRRGVGHHRRRSGRGCRARRSRRRRRGGRGEDGVRRRPHRRGPAEDPGDQGRARGHRPRPQGGQGPRRLGARSRSRRA